MSGDEQEACTTIERFGDDLLVVFPGGTQVVMTRAYALKVATGLYQMATRGGDSLDHVIAQCLGGGDQ